MYLLKKIYCFKIEIIIWTKAGKENKRTNTVHLGYVLYEHFSDRRHRDMYENPKRQNETTETKRPKQPKRNEITQTTETKQNKLEYSW